MIETRKSNATAHPGNIVQKSQQKKRTKQEIADDIANVTVRSPCLSGVCVLGFLREVVPE